MRQVLIFGGEGLRETVNVGLESIFPTAARCTNGSNDDPLGAGFSVEYKSIRKGRFYNEIVFHLTKINKRIQSGKLIKLAAGDAKTLRAAKEKGRPALLPKKDIERVAQSTGYYFDMTDMERRFWANSENTGKPKFGRALPWPSGVLRSIGKRGADAMGQPSCPSAPYERLGSFNQAEFLRRANAPKPIRPAASNGKPAGSGTGATAASLSKPKIGSLSPHLRSASKSQVKIADRARELPMNPVNASSAPPPKLVLPRSEPVPFSPENSRILPPSTAFDFTPTAFTEVEKLIPTCGVLEP